MVKLDELKEELKLLEGFMETKLQKLMDKIDDLENYVNDLEDKVKPKTYNKPDVDKNASYDNKRNTYLNKLNNNEIMYPKSSTLEYYKIKKQGDRYV